VSTLESEVSDESAGVDVASDEIRRWSSLSEGESCVTSDLSVTRLVYSTSLSIFSEGLPIDYRHWEAPKSDHYTQELSFPRCFGKMAS
jgi:hypothetical protein